MTTILRSAQAGIEKKNDVLVEISPNENGSGICIELSSPVSMEFGSQIEETVRAVLHENEVTDCFVIVRDKGAMDFTLRARTETAVHRATSEVRK